MQVMFMAKTYMAEMQMGKEEMTCEYFFFKI